LCTSLRTSNSNRIAGKTFILSCDSKLTLSDLDALIRPSQYRSRLVEVLVSTVSHTAGARSTLASDQSTSALISQV
jgi:hypothetical protein